MGCGAAFTGAEPFDQHRVGQFTVLPPSYGRSCLSPDAMFAKGMRQDERGRWMQAVKALRAVVAEDGAAHRADGVTSG